MDSKADIRHLSEADQHLSDAERRVTEQEIVLEKLRRGGLDTRLAEKTLNACKATLEAFRDRRETIIKTIELDRSRSGLK